MLLVLIKMYFSILIASCFYSNTGVWCVYVDPHTPHFCHTHTHSQMNGDITLFSTHADAEAS